MKTTAVSFFLIIILSVFLSPSAARSSESMGGKAFTAKGCGSCHSVERPSGKLSRAAVLAKKGPDLWYAGSKFREGFLERWLANPLPIRPLAYNSLEKKNSADHPRLEAGMAKSVASYLMSLKAEGLVPEAGIRPGVNVRGRISFIKKFACYGCHLVNVRGSLAGGLSGPSLEGTRDRLNPQWVYAYLRNQRAFTPVSRMPVYEGLATEAQMKALASYVSALK